MVKHQLHCSTTKKVNEILTVLGYIWIADLKNNCKFSELVKSFIIAVSGKRQINV